MRRYAAVLLLLAGCDLYFGGDDEPPPPCDGWGTGGAAQEFRNPQTGECQGFGGGCYDSCGPCDYAALSIAQPDWGTCYSKCDGLDEQSCLGASGCIAAYDEFTDLADAPSITTFKGCWATPPSGPIQGGGCWALDAQECSRHDDCSMYFGDGFGGDTPTNGLVASQTFQRCGPEPTTQGCTEVDCGPGSHCEDQCYPCDGKTGPCPAVCTPVCVPDEPSCAAVDCGPGYTCIETCTGMDPTPSGGGAVPPGQCYAQCVPSGGGNPGSCTGQVLCDALPPACPANTTAGRENGCWTGYCIPNSACGPNDPGSCDGVTVCAVPPPACPSGTVAGVLNGCWSGYCIPQSACPVAACETLTTENACLARPECTPVYGGSNCTCSPGGGCTCETLTYERCETWWL